MQLFTSPFSTTFVAAALILASSNPATATVHTEVQHNQHHPAADLFLRHNARSSGPVELWTGGDPQLEILKRDPFYANRNAPIKRGPFTKRRCGDLHDMMPEAIKKRDGEKRLVRRQQTTSPGTGTAYPEAGSDSPPASTLPKAWVDKYNQVKAAGLIPNIPVATPNDAGLVDYPAGTLRGVEGTCEWGTEKCLNNDIFAAPDGMVALGVDDGPTPNGTVPYLQILNDEKVSVTHFLIGSAIYWNMDVMKELVASEQKQHLAVHTWSHTQQAIKTDLEVIGDLGWTMQIIYDVSGYIPMYFRPPEGVIDNRVRAIARHVFGLQNVMWDRDADDWCLRQDTGTADVSGCPQSAPNLDFVRNAEVEWADKSANNSGWLSLNHETTNQGAQAFQAMVQAIKKNGWDFVGIVSALQGLPAYNNAYNLTDTPTKQDNILPTHNFINVTDPTAALGSADAPKLGDWSTSAATSVGSQTSGSNASGSSTSANASKSATSSSTRKSATSTGSSSTSSSSSSSSTSGAQVAIAPSTLTALCAAALLVGVVVAA